MAIPAMVIAGFITFATLKSHSAADPVTPLDSITAPEHGDTGCSALLRALPATISGYRTRTVSDDGLIRWPAGDGRSGPITMRCGVNRPAELAPTSGLITVSPVQWFTPTPQQPDGTSTAASGRDSRADDTQSDTNGQLWYAVDRRPYVALWLPRDSGNAPITEISSAIASTLPASPIDVGAGTTPKGASTPTSPAG